MTDRTIDNSLDVARKWTGAALADSSVSAEKLAEGAVEATDIADSSVTAAKLATGAVTATKLGALAVGTAALAALAVTTAKIAALAVDDTKLAALAVTTGKIAALAVDDTKLASLAVTTGKIAAGAVTKAKAAMFVSTEQTGTGASQNVAHGLGVVPAAVLIVPTDTAPATVGEYTAVEGVHTTTNVVLTVTTGKKFKVWAMA